MLRYVSCTIEAYTHSTGDTRYLVHVTACPLVSVELEPLLVVRRSRALEQPYTLRMLNPYNSLEHFPMRGLNYFYLQKRPLNQRS